MELFVMKEARESPVVSMKIASTAAAIAFTRVHQRRRRQVKTNNSLISLSMSDVLFVVNISPVNARAIIHFLSFEKVKFLKNYSVHQVDESFITFFINWVTTCNFNFLIGKMRKRKDGWMKQKERRWWISLQLKSINNLPHSCGSLAYERILSSFSMQHRLVVLYLYASSDSFVS